MICTLNELQNKEVISVFDGKRLGFVDDVEMDTETASLISFIIYGRPKFFGLFGRDEDIVVKCEEIRLIGEDIILVNLENDILYSKKHKFSFESSAN